MSFLRSDVPIARIFQSEYAASKQERLYRHRQSQAGVADLPIDGRSMKAAMLARCMPADKYFDFLERAV